MAHFVATYEYSAAETELAAVRAEHREYLAGLDELLISGPADDGRGAVLVFEAETAEQVEALLDADPFVVQGLVGEHRVRPWKPVLGRLLEHF